jgi:hypothetical protein
MFDPVPASIRPYQQQEHDDQAAADEAFDDALVRWLADVAAQGGGRD